MHWNHFLRRFLCYQEGVNNVAYITQSEFSSTQRRYNVTLNIHGHNLCPQIRAQHWRALLSSVLRLSILFHDFPLPLPSRDKARENRFRTRDVFAPPLNVFSLFPTKTLLSNLMLTRKRTPQQTPQHWRSQGRYRVSINLVSST